MRSSPPRPPDRPRATRPVAKSSISGRSAPECSVLAYPVWECSIWECSVSAYPISKRPVWECLAAKRSISECSGEGCTAAGCVAEGCAAPGRPASEGLITEYAKRPLRAATSGSCAGEGGASERFGSAGGVRSDRPARQWPAWRRPVRQRSTRQGFAQHSDTWQCVTTRRPVRQRVTSRRSARQCVTSGRSARQWVTWQWFARQRVTWQWSVRRRRGGRGPVNDQGPGAASSRGPASPRPPAKTRSPELPGSFPVGPLPGGARLPLRVSPRRGPAILGCGHPNEGYWAQKQPIRIGVR